MTHTVSPRRTPVRRAAAVLAVLLALPPVGPRAAHARPRRNVTRLHFRPGRSRLVVGGSVGDGQRGGDYAFSAEAGQRLRIDLFGVPPPRPGRSGGIVPTYVITFPSGKQYQPKGDPFDGRLTETGTYRIAVGINRMASDATHGRFRMILSRSGS